MYGNTDASEAKSHVKPPKKLKVGQITPRRTVPKDIPRPWYVLKGERCIPKPKDDIMIHTPETLPKMRRACKLAANILAEVEDIIQPGVTTDTIDAFVHNATISAGAYPSPLNYGKFPKSVCTSVNECVCHGIPDTRPLQEGDILNVDVTVFLDGFHGDTSRMFKVGKIHPVSERLIQQSMEATMAGIKVCAPGVPIPAIGKAVHDYCDAHELQTCAELVGHGVGSDFHVNPPIFHVRAHKLMPQDQVMHVNQTFTVEPAIMLGGNGIRILEDNWSMLAEDGCYAAQHEHTILITETGYEILTIPDPPEVRKKKIKSRKVQ